MFVRKIRFIALFCLFSSLFISCENIISPREENHIQETSSESGNNNSRPVYANLSGRYREAGNQAFFASFNEFEKTFLNRSALPELGSSANQIQYYVIARAENESPVTGSVNTLNRSFFIAGLKINKTWTVELGIKVQNTAADGSTSWVRCFYDISDPVLLTEENFVMNLSVVFKLPLAILNRSLNGMPL